MIMSNAFVLLRVFADTCEKHPEFKKKVHETIVTIGEKLTGEKLTGERDELLPQETQPLNETDVTASMQETMQVLNNATSSFSAVTADVPEKSGLEKTIDKVEAVVYRRDTHKNTSRYKEAESVLNTNSFVDGALAAVHDVVDNMV